MLKERLKQLKGLVLQSVLDKNNVSLPELIKTISELYSDSEELPLQDEYTEEKENGRFKPTS